MTFCVILWSLGHPILGIFALFCGDAKTRTYIKTQFIDSRTGKFVKDDGTPVSS